MPAHGKFKSRPKGAQKLTEVNNPEDVPQGYHSNGQYEEEENRSTRSDGPVEAWQQDLVEVDIEGSESERPETGERRPSKDTFKLVPGYEMVADFGDTFLIPPPPPAAPLTERPAKTEFVNMDMLGEMECRNSMLDFVSQHCCYGKSAARAMSIKRIEPTSALHYILESYTEARSVSYAFKPYTGGIVDGVENGPPPLPWDIPYAPSNLFTDEIKLIEVPHTSFVISCHVCSGGGYVRCDRCYGKTYVRCNNCHGRGQVSSRGHQTKERCSACKGDGRRRCQRCVGRGRIECRMCQAACRLKCFIQLTIKFTNRQDDYILEETDMPDELIRDVSGGTILEQIMDQIWPVTGYTVDEVNINSGRLVERHKVAFPSDRLYKQRHTLRAVPVTEVHYGWKNVNTRYWIYGKEHKVYAPDYPQTCCWGCCIS